MLDLHAVRSQFPSLSCQIQERIPLFLDGPGGTQVPQSVIDAVSNYFLRSNSNHGGAFTTSRLSDQILENAHAAVADLLNAPSAEEIVFGQNMTSLTFHVSRSIGRTWKPGDAICVTRLDHDANVRPWILAARDAGAEVRLIDVRPDGTLDQDDFARKITGARFLALTCASNALGTMPDVAHLTSQAHAAGALVYLDAVHYTPHAGVDVQAWGCDFLACSAYKFFGPHVGILWGRRELLGQIEPYKVRPATDSLPGKWMTGTQNHEGIAGVLAAVEYLASLGQGSTRRQRLSSAMTAIRRYEVEIGSRLLTGLANRPAWRLWGLGLADTMTHRTPTFAITHSKHSPRQVVEHLASHEIYAWSGNFYAQEVSERLGAEAGGGFVRLGLVHYNTAAEVDRTLAALDQLGS